MKITVSNDGCINSELENGHRGLKIPKVIHHHSWDEQRIAVSIILYFKGFFSKEFPKPY
jgi:hypothetical protein